MVMLDLLTYIIFDRLHFFIENKVGIIIEKFNLFCSISVVNINFHQIVFIVKFLWYVYFFLTIIFHILSVNPN
jgi:hypothetical protein